MTAKTDQLKPSQRANKLLIDSVTSRKGWSLPERDAAVSVDTAIAAMLAFAEAESRAPAPSAEDIRRLIIVPSFGGKCDQPTAI